MWDIENWLPVIGYEEIYECSDLGRIRTKKRGKILNGCINPDGYIVVNLSKNKNHKCHLLHRLIAKTWILNPFNKPTVNHKKGIKIDNRITEIEWATHSENNKHSFDKLGRKSGTFGKKGSLSHSSKPVLCINDKKRFVSATEAAKNYNIGVWSVTSVFTGMQTKTRSGLTFKYIK